MLAAETAGLLDGSTFPDGMVPGTSARGEQVIDEQDCQLPRCRGRCARGRHTHRGGRGRFAVVMPALVLLGMATGGCSFLFMRSPPDAIPSPEAPVECTSSSVAPVMDTTCASLGLAIFSAALAEPADCNTSQPGGCLTAGEVVGVAVGAAAMTVACTFAAAHGYKQATRCEKLKTLSLWCRGGELTACQQLVPGWVPPLPAPVVPREPMPSAPPPPPYAPPPPPPPVSPPPLPPPAGGAP